jgi:hypothetical protein
MSDDYTALDDEQRIGRIGAENEHTVLGPDVMPDEEDTDSEGDDNE